MGKPVPSTRDPGKGETGKPRRTGEGRKNGGASASRRRSGRGGGEMEEPALVAALSLCGFDYWRALPMAAARFRRCFFFFNCLFFSQRSSSLSSSSASTAIDFLILPSSLQSVPVCPLWSFFSKSYLALGGPTSKSLVGLMCMPIVRKVWVATFKMFLASFCSNSVLKLLVV